MPLPAGSARRALLRQLAIVCVAIALGLALQHVVTGRLAAIELRSRTDLLGARAELATLLQIMSVSVFGLTGTVGVMMVLASRRSLELLEFPPPGLLAWGRRRPPLTGPLARKAAWVGVVLGVTLILASAAGGGLMWYAALVLRACRAGVTATGPG